MNNLWTSNPLSVWKNDRGLSDPFATMRREMDAVLSRFSKSWPDFSADANDGAWLAAGAPAVNIAETKDTIEISAELPGLDEKDVQVRTEDHRLIIRGERKMQSEKKEKDWRIVESAFGSFQRIIPLPFVPADNAVSAQFDKGMLQISIKKPPEQIASSRKIEIKPVKAT